ncbi:uncharacterized protein LOC126588330 isoform X6 [Malus sylvestris]|uniref:uncharacterized protein LOC126588330 isoform X6 n=1 Tax=Malus sylvestris TaxID=3752 RepID=UPI0021ACA7E1|nr:uncharacterized protein LOC126588330 isoform X6 [Malus sylvestris]
MEGEPCDVVPCSSVTVDSILRIGTAGAIWGLCAGPHDARKQGEVGWNVWSSVWTCCWNLYSYSLRASTISGKERLGEWCGCWCSSRGSYCRYDTKLDAGDSYGLSGFCLQSCH